MSKCTDLSPTTHCIAFHNMEMLFFLVIALSTEIYIVLLPPFAIRNNDIMNTLIHTYLYGHM